MKIESRVRAGASNVQDTGMCHSPVQVCMLVLGVARTDVRVMREATALLEAGFEVTIVDVEREPARPDREYLQGIYMKHIVNPEWYVSTHFKPWFLVKLALMIIRSTLRLMRTPANIYHAHDDIALPACYFAARLRRKPLIFDAHELPLSETSVTRWRRLRALSARIFANIVSYCAGVITVSHPIAQEIHKHYRSPTVTLIRNVPTYQITTRNDCLRQALDLPLGVRVALYQGALQSNRGLASLIRAAPFLDQNIVIVLMGSGSEMMLSELEALIIEQGVADRVKLMPAVPYSELLHWSASADLGLIVYNPTCSLNVRMCLPNKLFEYLMAGLPVLSSQLDAVEEVINTYQVGRIISSLAPQDVAATINAMLSDQSGLEQMRRLSLEVARKEFCWEREAPLLIRLYHDIIAFQDAEHMISQTPAGNTNSTYRKDEDVHHD